MTFPIVLGTITHKVIKTKVDKDTEIKTDINILNVDNVSNIVTKAD